MPSKYYMGNDLRHDHIFRAPRPDLSVKHGMPNACNNCHKDKSFQWSADAIVKWYGPNRTYLPAEDLAAGATMDLPAQAHLIKLLNDTSTPSIIQATAVHYIANINDAKSLQILLQQLNHQNAQVRYRAVMGLTNFPVLQWQSEVIKMLSDEVRAVRIAAANALLGIHANGDETVATPLKKANEELKNYIMYQTDFASGNVMAADYFMKIQDNQNAEKFYLRALQKDDRMNYARLNLSTMYNMTGRNADALKVLQDAAKTDPSNDRIFFNLALLYNELNDAAQVEKNLQKAIALQSQNPRVYYNYAILQQQKQNYREAEKQYQKALSLAPLDADINYALCVLYMQENEPAKAMPYAQTLKKYYPGDQRFVQLWQQLGM